MAEIKRHEIKYIISLREAELLKYRLRALLRPDPHARTDGSYFIRSLYFDDTDYRAYHEKIAGVKERTKYRIRFYNMDDSRITLEKKSKDGDFSGKESVRISRELTEAFLTGGEAAARYRRARTRACPAAAERLEARSAGRLRPVSVRLSDGQRSRHDRHGASHRAVQNQPFRRPRAHCAGAR